MPRRALEMNALDRAVAWVAPGLALRRAQSRTALSAATGGYTGARKDRGVFGGWSLLSGRSADSDTLPDLPELRARSRDLVRNDPVAQSGISTKVVNVIGPGHMVRPELDAAQLRLTEAQAQDWESEALRLWTHWAGSRDCDVTRAQTFAELEDLVYRSQLLSGDVLVIRRFRERPGRLLGTCLQVVEADRLSNPHWAADSDTLAGGIEYDVDGAPLAYHVADRYAYDRNLGGGVTWQRIPAYDDRGRWQVLHIHGVMWRPDMSRYAPMLAPVIAALKARSDYSEAELTAAVVSACFAIGMKSPDGDMGAGLQTGSEASEARKELKLTDPGMIVDLMPDEEIMSFAPGRPNPQFTPFIDAIAQEIGAGIDLPYELLLKQFQASYSASRAALEMAWQFFRVERARHVAQFCQPVYAAVIGECVARGLLAAPGFFTDPLRAQGYCAATWMGPSRITIDPVKDATADEKYLAMGATSLTEITAVRFGRDHRDVRRRRAIDGSDAIAAPGGARPIPPEDATDDGGDMEGGARNALR